MCKHADFTRAPSTDGADILADDINNGWDADAVLAAIPLLLVWLYSAAIYRQVSNNFIRQMMIFPN